MSTYIVIEVSEKENVAEIMSILSQSKARFIVTNDIQKYAQEREQLKEHNTNEAKREKAARRSTDSLGEVEPPSKRAAFASDTPAIVEIEPSALANFNWITPKIEEPSPPLDPAPQDASLSHLSNMTAQINVWNESQTTPPRESPREEDGRVAYKSVETLRSVETNGMEEGEQKTTFGLIGAELPGSKRITKKALVEIANTFRVTIGAEEVQEIEQMESRVIDSRRWIVFFTVTTEREKTLREEVESLACQTTDGQDQKVVLQFDEAIGDVKKYLPVTRIEFYFEFAKAHPGLFSLRSTGLLTSDGNLLKLEELFGAEHFQMAETVIDKFTRTAKKSLLQRVCAAHPHSEPIRNLCIKNKVKIFPNN